MRPFFERQGVKIAAWEQVLLDLAPNAEAEFLDHRISRVNKHACLKEWVLGNTQL